MPSGSGDLRGRVSLEETFSPRGKGVARAAEWAPWEEGRPMGARPHGTGAQRVDWIRRSPAGL